MVRHSGISVFLFSEVPANSSNYNLIQHNNNTSSQTGYSLIEKYRSGELRLLYTIQSCWAPFTVHYTDPVSSVYRALYSDTDLVSSLRLDAMTFGSAPRGESKPGGQNNWGGYNGDKNGKNRDLERYWIKKKKKVLETWLSEFHNDKSSVSVVHTIPGIILLQLCSCIMVIEHMDHYGPF